MCVAKLTWTQKADTKEITVDIVDASIVKLTLSYLYTSDYEDIVPAISKDFTDCGYACSMSDAKGSGDSTDGSYADALISGIDQNDGDRSEQSLHWRQLTSYRKSCLEIEEDFLNMDA